MPTKNAKKKAAVPNSPELGTGDFGISYNAKTGRPVRKSLPRKVDSPFVDSAIAISDDSDSGVGSADEGIVVKSKKRKRSPSPDLTDLDEKGPASESELSDVSLSDIESDREEISSSTEPLAPLQVTLNVPAGQERQITLNIDLGTLLGNRLPKPMSSSTVSRRPQVRSRRAAPSRPTKVAAKPATPTKANRSGSPALSVSSSSAEAHEAGFLDLPAELRNEIYRLAFAAPVRLDFGNPGLHFQRSSALLRTCKQVHTEGRDILYSENEFFFRRRCQRHGSLWNDDWSELGFKPVRHFLKMIGPTNTALIRHITFLFEDATPSLNPHMLTAEDRRFVHDEILYSVLRHLSQHGRLQKLDMNFQGRKTLEVWFPADHFLDILMRVKSDEVQFVKHPIWGSYGAYHTRSKQSSTVEKMLLEGMVRKKKIFVI